MSSTSRGIRFIPLTNLVAVKNLPGHTGRTIDMVMDDIYRSYVKPLIHKHHVLLDNTNGNDRLREIVDALKESQVWKDYGEFVADDLEALWQGKLYYLGLRVALTLTLLSVHPTDVNRKRNQLNATSQFAVAADFVLNAFMGAQKLQREEVTHRDPQMAKLVSRLKEHGVMTRRDITRQCVLGSDRNKNAGNALIADALREGVIVQYIKEHVLFEAVCKAHGKPNTKAVEVFTLKP